jgi:ADP-ribosylglycohydrolase
MIDNTEYLQRLCAKGRVKLTPGPFLDSIPGRYASSIGFDRVEGMLLGLAIGDALGNTSEGMPPIERAARHGEIRDYLPGVHGMALGKLVGLPSDDTQLAYWTLEQLLKDDGLVPDHLARRFCRERIFGIGASVRQFVRRYAVEGRPWCEAGVASAGNGALMRIAPVLLPHLRTPSRALWADTVLAATLTHNDAGSSASCVAFVNMLWELLQSKDLPEEGWWVETYCRVAGALEGDTTYSPRCDTVVVQHHGPIWQFAERAVSLARERGWGVREACERWHSGAYLLETVPSVLYILERHAHDPEEAIVRAVNDTWDNDTIAAIVGAAVGALHGRKGLPERWIEGLLGRTGATDDGRVFELVRKARGAFGSG